MENQKEKTGFLESSKLPALHEKKIVQTHKWRGLKARESLLKNRGQLSELSITKFCEFYKDFKELQLNQAKHKEN